ncbi:hypothetical protein [Streptomyces sp. TLI_185]|uniref:hypothetical protein n=1 Tax=Streptomyces sp. TLI_185 TaxID=2485151 RepID=UPI000F94A0E4|nr:hypothetical protein [Streptomyces sp. TLI_185]RPF34185.1 hypothetical protein EDD92_4128 [Streptomyces sp. TLI_185]
MTTIGDHRPEEAVLGRAKLGLIDRWDGRRILLIAHSANKWSLDRLLGGARIEALVRSLFVWNPGWEYRA